MFDRILQDRQSIAINRTDTSTTKSKQLYPAIPVSKISSWAGGEFVGMVVDDGRGKSQMVL